MIDSVVSRWFGPAFDQLDPLLQDLHRHGGRLEGDIELSFGRGLAGLLGRRLARKMGLPTQPGNHRLAVDISHDPSTLYWDRCFDGGQRMASVFQPAGHWPDGFWIERTGAIELRLGVELVNGGWFWRLRSARIGRLPVPRWGLPRSEAGKIVVDGRYRFFVAFSLPLLGRLLCYGGDLSRQD